MSIIKQTSKKLVLEQRRIGLLRGVGLSFMVAGLCGFVALGAGLTVFALLAGAMTGKEFFIVGRQTVSNAGMVITLGSLFIVLFLSLFAYMGPKMALLAPAVTCTFDGTTGFLIIEQQQLIGISRIRKYSFTEMVGTGVEASSGYDLGDNHDIFLVLRSSRLSMRSLPQSTEQRVSIIRYSTAKEAQRVSQAIAAFVNIRYYGLV